MSFATAPASLSRALTVDGGSWSEFEVAEAFDWVFGASLRALLHAAAGVLVERPIEGRSAGEVAKDAEDACQDFAYKRFRKVVRRYNPNHPAHKSFESFVLFCFRRWCRARARVLRRGAQRMQPEHVFDLDRRPGGWRNPEAVLLRSLERRATAKAIRNALAKIKDKRNRTIIELQFWDDTCVAERAAAIGMSPGATRVRTYRTLRRLAPELRGTAKALGFGGS